MLFRQIQLLLNTPIKLFFSYSASQTSIVLFFWRKYFTKILIISLILIGFF